MSDRKSENNACVSILKRLKYRFFETKHHRKEYAMKQAFGIFAALILMPAFQVQAWTGGPWSNDSYQANGDDGVYEAVGTFTDGTAMYRWAVYNEAPGLNSMQGGQANGALTSNVQFGSLVGAQNPHVIWYRGIVYYGRCFGIVNSNMKLVMVTGNASDTGLNGSDGQMNGVDLNTGATSSIEISGGAGSSATIPDRKRLANSTFKAKINKSYPSKRFHGYGTISFVGEPNFDIIVVTVPTVTTVASVTSFSVTSQSSSSSFLQVGHRVGMKIFGTQVSTQVSG
ncbi:MAG: hypothetical protein KDN19_14805 [Verrucomicrobiae bacterium]|nr:hypothetical protein [Verrucomicrobiae bacterium]